MAHRVQRVCNDDDDGVGRILHHLLGDTPYDLLVVVEQVSTAHPRLARLAAGYHDHVRAGGVLVVVRTDDVGVEAEDGAGLHDVHEHHVGDVAHGKVQGRGASDVARADYRYLELPWHRQVLLFLSASRNNHRGIRAPLPHTPQIKIPSNALG